jgi:hypothetical protein
MLQVIKKFVLNGKVLLISLILLAIGLIIVHMALTRSSSITPTFADQTVDSLKFTEAILDGKKLTVTVTNTTSTSYNLKTITVTYLDSASKDITAVKGYIGNTIAANDSKQLVITTDVDLTNAKSVAYTINK